MSERSGTERGLYAGDEGGAQAGAVLPVLVVGGPTASGKSGLALMLAERLGGTVINADSMQVYQMLRVVTARPGPEEEVRVPHRLYGIVPPSERMSAARWRDLAIEEIRRSHAEGRLPIVVGGTGLYLRTLMQGIVEIPDIPDDIRREALELQQEIGTPALHARLAALDPETAARLNPTDTTRVVRAFEVVRATGQGITEWQRTGRHDVPADLAFHPLVVEPPRERLYAQCDARFLAMLDQGALEEVRALEAMNLDPMLPAMKALGVPELRAHLHGDWDLPTATAKAQQFTRNYAKRQSTWFRNQLAAAPRTDPAELTDRIAAMKFCNRIAARIGMKISKPG